MKGIPVCSTKKPHLSKEDNTKIIEILCLASFNFFSSRECQLCSDEVPILTDDVLNALKIPDVYLVDMTIDISINSSSMSDSPSHYEL